MLLDFVQLISMIYLILEIFLLIFPTRMCSHQNSYFRIRDTANFDQRIYAYNILYCTFIFTTLSYFRLFHCISNIRRRNKINAEKNWGKMRVHVACGAGVQHSSKWVKMQLGSAKAACFLHHVVVPPFSIPYKCFTQSQIKKIASISNDLKNSSPILSCSAT